MDKGGQYGRKWFSTVLRCSSCGSRTAVHSNGAGALMCERCGWRNEKAGDEVRVHYAVGALNEPGWHV